MDGAIGLDLGFEGARERKVLAAEGLHVIEAELAGLEPRVDHRVPVEVRHSLSFGRNQGAAEGDVGLPTQKVAVIDCDSLCRVGA